MILCLDIGNTHIYGGVFENDNLLMQFRYPSKDQCTSDSMGIFFKTVLRENNIDPSRIEQVAACSVVPALDYSIRSVFIKYFDITPFMLQAGVKTGLQIKAKNPQEVGTDRIANAIAATKQFPDKNIIVVDFGTATTFDAISAAGEYLGGAIIPGMGLSMQSLSQNTAQLSSVRIIKPSSAMALTTATNLQVGIYYGHLGALKEILQQMQKDIFKDQAILTIGTGGFAQLFEAEDLFSAIIPDLVLQGLKVALLKNQ